MLASRSRSLSHVRSLLLITLVATALLATVGTSRALAAQPVTRTGAASTDWSDPGN